MKRSRNSVKMRRVEVIYVRIGAAIRQARIQAGLTQAQLAAALQIGRTSITNIEDGRQRVPIHQVERIATVLDIDFEDLIA